MGDSQDAQKPPSERPFSRLPVLSTVAAFAAGIVVDRNAAVPLGAALTAGFLAVIAACFWFHRRPFLATLAILTALLCTGAARHALVWSLRSPLDVTNYAIPDGSPIRVRGVIDSEIEIIPAEYSASTPSWRLLDRSVCVLRCESLGDAAGWRPSEGRVRLTVEGHLLHIQEGDRVELVGQFRQPQPPRLASDFDFRSWLRAQGIDRIIDANHPDAVRRLESTPGWLAHFGRFRKRLRDECNIILKGSLSERTYPVGSSLLLGTRTGLTEEVREAFINSGTMHLLAISGLHVGILAACVLVLCRLLNLSVGTTTLVVLLVLWGYVVITDLRPPVLRSAIGGSLVAIGIWKSRSRSSLNLLVAAALILLVRNPCDLFDVGAQLSFLAVAAIIWSARLIRSLPTDRHSLLLASDLPRWRRVFNENALRLRNGYVVTAAVWLFTLPITMAWFQLISPVGFLINVVLIPLSAHLLACGFLTLAMGLIWPPLAVVPAIGYEACLRVLLSIVDWSAGTRWGHWTTPGPSTAWLIVFYALLAVAVLTSRLVWRRWAWRGLAFTVAVPLAMSFTPLQREGLRCTFIDVGHGGAILLELPGGRTMLFDAGSFANERRAQEAIAHALWEKKIREVDAVVISHADMDHFNAVSHLMNEFPVGGLFFPGGFVDFEQPGVADVCETASRNGVPQTIVQAGDRLMADEDVTIEVLHPAARFQDNLDNAGSLVLRIEYAGRTILLTGDVERAGLIALLQGASGPVDVLQAPHHGARSANTSDLARWANPRWIVVCTGDPDVRPRLFATYPHAEEICSSAEAGTISVHISPAGELDVQREGIRQPG